MSRFRAGAARRSARLSCDEVDGSRVAGNRSSTPLPRPPVGPLAGRRESRARRTALELAASAGLRQRPAAQNVRTGARSGFRRLVRQTRSCAAGDRAGSARPLHGPRFRGRRRHDARRGWGARSCVAVARRSFAGPAGATASRLAAILSSLPGSRRPTLFPEGMAPGDDDRLRASREPPARPLPGLRTGIGAVQPGVAAAVRTIAPPHGFDLASAKAARLGAGARRAAANLADLGRRVTDANSAVVDAILALPAKLDPLRAAALTALPTSDRARALPALASDIDRLCAAATNGTTNRKRCVETTPAPQASLPALLAAYAAVCQRRRILRDR